MAEKKGTALPLRLGRWVVRHKFGAFGTAFVAVECLLVTVVAVFAAVFYAPDVAMGFVVIISFVSIFIALGIPRQKSGLLRVALPRSPAPHRDSLTTATSAMPTAIRRSRPRGRDSCDRPHRIEATSGSSVTPTQFINCPEQFWWRVLFSAQHGPHKPVSPHAVGLVPIGRSRHVGELARRVAQLRLESRKGR